MKREHHIARDNEEQDVYELQAGILSAYGAKEERRSIHFSRLRHVVSRAASLPIGQGV